MTHSSHEARHTHAGTLPGAPPAWQLARSDDGVVVWEEVAGWLRVVVLGPAVGQPTLRRAFRHRARRAVLDGLHAALPQGDGRAECRRLLVHTDAALRRALSDDDPGRATMLVAVVRDGAAWVGHTGDGAACLLREGGLQWLLSSLPTNARTRAQRTRSEMRRLVVPSVPPPPEVPWIGRRLAGDTGPVCVDVRAEPVSLCPGDRLLLTSVAAAELRRVGAFVTLLDAHHVDDAAQGLGSALTVHGEANDLAVAVLAWRPRRSDRGDGELSEQALTDDLVDDFADLIRDITDELDVGATPTFEDRVAGRLDEAELMDVSPAAARAAPPRPPSPAPPLRREAPSQPTLEPPSVGPLAAPLPAPAPTRRPWWWGLAFVVLAVLGALAVLLR